VVEGRIGEPDGGVAMGKEVFLEEAKILMKLVEETLEVVDAEELMRRGGGQ
jgi:hypothetical protein